MKCGGRGPTSLSQGFLFSLFAGGQRGVAGRCAGSRRLGKGYDLGGLTACMKGVCDRRELKLPASG